MSKINETIYKIMASCGIEICGITDFAALEASLIKCSAKRLLPQNSKSVIIALFPYYSGEYENANISKYSIPEDYHIIVGQMLAEAAARLKETFMNFEFVPFCDASPIPEVKAAVYAGLGVQGKNGLLINKDYGSFVFIGEIVTDLTTEFDEVSVTNCINCGKCISNCPSGALSETKFDKTLCISYITQRKGELNVFERQMIKKSGSIWGCDICQNVCPQNRDIKITPIDEFKTDCKPIITQPELEDDDFDIKNARRAYIWKGKNVLERNFEIVSTAP